MKLESIQLNLTDVIKLIGFVLVISSMWYDLKTDFDVHKSEHKIIEYRLARIEALNNLAINTYEHAAVVPRETKLENENKRTY